MEYNETVSYYLPGPIGAPYQIREMVLHCGVARGCPSAARFTNARIVHSHLDKLLRCCCSLVSWHPSHRFTPLQRPPDLNAMGMVFDLRPFALTGQFF